MSGVSSSSEQTALLSQFKSTLSDTKKKEFESLPVAQQISIMSNSEFGKGRNLKTSNQSIFGEKTVADESGYAPDKAPEKVEVLMNGKKRFVTEKENSNGTITSLIYAEDGKTLLNETIYAKVTNGSWDKPVKKTEYNTDGTKTITEYKDGKVSSQKKLDKGGKEIPPDTDYVVQNNESIESIVRKSLAAQGIKNPTPEQLNTATKEFIEANKDKIKTNGNGVKYLIVGDTVKVKGKVDTTGNKSSKEAINDYAKDELNRTSERIKKYEGKTKEYKTNPGDSYYSIAKKLLKEQGIENPTQEQVIQMQNDLIALNNNKRLAPNDTIIVPKSEKELQAEEKEVADAKAEVEANKQKTQKANSDAPQIADGLIKSMEGMGTKFIPFKENIAKINKDNVIETIDAYRKKSSDESLIEAIGDEKGMALQHRANAINHIKSAIVGRAKAAGINTADFENKFNTEFKAQQDKLGPMDMEKLDIMLESFVEQVRTAESVKQEKVEDKANGTNHAEARESVTAEEAHDYALLALNESLEEAKEAFQNGVDADGWAGLVADSVSAIWSSKNRAGLVEGDLQKFETQIKTLESAAKGELKDANGNAISFEAAYKKAFGVEFNKDNLIAYATAQEDYNTAVNAQKYESILGPHISKYDAGGKKYNKENMVQLENAFKSVFGENGLEQIFKDQGLDLSTISDEDAYNVLAEYARTFVDTTNQNSKEARNGKSLQELKHRYDRSYTAAFGTENDMNKRVTDYVNSQQTGAATVKGAVVLAATVATAGAGTPLVTAGLGIAGMSAAVEITDRLSNNIDNSQDLSLEEILEITKNAAVDGGIYAASMGLMKMMPGLSSKSALQIAKQAAKETTLDASIGIAGDYVKTGDVTTEGVAFNLLLSAAGRLGAIKEMKKARAGMQEGTATPAATKQKAEPNSPAQDPPKYKKPENESILEKATRDGKDPGKIAPEKSVGTLSHDKFKQIQEEVDNALLNANSADDLAILEKRISALQNRQQRRILEAKVKAKKEMLSDSVQEPVVKKQETTGNENAGSENSGHANSNNKPMSYKNTHNMQDVDLKASEAVIVDIDAQIRLGDKVDIDLSDFKDKINTMKDGESFLIGRAVSGANDIKINNPHISGKHIKIEKIDGKIVVTALGSTNGTTINTTKPDYAAKFDPKEANKFNNGSYPDFYALYRKNYEKLRLADYTPESTHRGNVAQFDDYIAPNWKSTKEADISVTSSHGWNWRKFNNGNKMGNVVDRVSLNVVADRNMIKELDNLMLKGEYINSQGQKVKLSKDEFTNGYYKTPTNANEWLSRHDPITMYFDKEASPQMLTAIAEVTQKYARTPSNGKALMNCIEKKPWIAHEAYTSPEKIQALYQKAKNINKNLADMIYDRSCTEGVWNVSTGQYAAFEKLINEFELYH